MRCAKVHHGRSRARIHGRDEKRYDAKDAINQLLFKKNATPTEMYNVQKKEKERSDLRGMYFLIIPKDSNREHFKNDHNLVNQ